MMFSPISPVLLVLGLLARTALAATQWESLKAVKAFADALLDPTLHVKQQGQGIFAEDVQGEIDVWSTIQGRNTASDYIFGPFAKAVESPAIPSFFGIPKSYNVTGLTLQHSTVTASILFELEYAAINQTIPLQVDGWYKVDDDELISQFSLTFKHWSWAMETLLPQITPAMATVLQLPSGTSSADILRDYLTAAVCMSATQGCTGAASQYSSYADCAAMLAEKPLGQWDHMADDSLLCRALASQLVAYNSTEHCPQLGNTGGDLCQNRTYAQSLAEPLPVSWNAAKVVTPENTEIVATMHFASGEPLNELLRISLSQNELHGWDPSLYATATFAYFLFMYFFTKLLWFVLERFHRVFSSLSKSHQKNVVMYTCQVIFTTIALILELLASPVFGGDYHLWSIKCLRASAITISTLYIFELVFRFDMRMPLVCHHILTIVAISYAVVMFEWTQDPGFAISGIIWLFQATAEQPTFIGLIGYRLKWNPRMVGRTLKFAAIQTFIVKTAAALGVVVYWALEQRKSTRPMDLAWSALVFIVAVGLMATQVWGSYVTYIIGVKVEKKHREGLNPPDSRVTSSTALPILRPEHRRIYSDSSSKHPAGMRSGVSSMSRLEMELGGTVPCVTFEDDKPGFRSMTSI